jgi:hypothetical protein
MVFFTAASPKSEYVPSVCLVSAPACMPAYESYVTVYYELPGHVTKLTPAPLANHVSFFLESQTFSVYERLMRLMHDVELVLVCLHSGVHDVWWGIAHCSCNCRCRTSRACLMSHILHDGRSALVAAASTCLTPTSVPTCPSSNC